MVKGGGKIYKKQVEEELNFGRNQFKRKKRNSNKMKI